MRLHRNLVAAVTQAVEEIFAHQQYADKVIERTLKSNKKWGKRDRHFIAQHTYEMVRWWRLVLETANYSVDAQTTDFWYLFGVWLTLKGEELPGWKEFQNINPSTLRHNYEAIKNVRHIRESIPDWIDVLGEHELGEAQWELELTAMNQPAHTVIRTNRLKTSKTALYDWLSKEGIAFMMLPWCKDAFVVKQEKSLQRSEAYKNGWFELQDAGSQLIAPFLGVKPGMNVIDACAGAGGKTLHLAALMQNKGNILAMDVNTSKLRILQQRAKRAGATIIKTQRIPKNRHSLHNSADRILLDVPCSGLGVLKRKPDTKWKLTPDNLRNVRKTQANILHDYSKMLKVGGKLVYATCSLLTSENQVQIDRFLDQQDGKFELVSDLALSPYKYGFDGFYMACLERKS
ncbi:MAG: RsmB/NOP family class I SAM-dependent RNA methyltransferase [Chitinophagales bacterium]